MVAGLGLALIGAAVERNLVFDARYFEQGKKPSFHQVYLARYDGKFRQQITSEPRDHVAALYVDHWHIAWVDVQIDPTKKYWEDDYVSGGKVMCLDLRSGERKELARLTAEQVPHCYGHDSQLYTGNHQRYRVTLSGLEQLESNEEAGRVWSGEDGGNPYHCKVAMMGKDYEFTWDPNNNIRTLKDYYQYVEIKCGDKRGRYRLSGDAIRDAFVTPKGHLILTTCVGWEKYEQNHWVYEFADISKKPRLIITDIGRIDLLPDRAIWLARQTGHRELAMERLNDGRWVYVNWLYSGNWHTGRRWTVANGLVDVGSYQLRPE